MEEGKHLIAFSNEEVVVIRQMLDVALKALGGRAAKAYVVLDAKFEAVSSPIPALNEQSPDA